MKPVVPSKHCKEEMIIRDITIEDIKKTIASPDKTKEGRANTIVVWKKFGNDGLKVIYQEQKARILVITTYLKLSI